MIWRGLAGFVCGRRRLFVFTDQIFEDGLRGFDIFRLHHEPDRKNRYAHEAHNIARLKLAADSGSFNEAAPGLTDQLVGCCSEYFPSH